MRKSALAVVAVAALFAFSVIAPSASALIVGAHSPVTVLLTDPNGHQFGCTDSLCTPSCTTNEPCSTNGTPSDFKNTLPSNECAPNCVYFVASASSIQYGVTAGDTYIGVPSPTMGTWIVTFNGIMGSTETTFTITAGSCPDQAAPSVTANDNHEGAGGCAIYCVIPDNEPGAMLCDADDPLVNGVTFPSMSVSSTGTVGSFSVNSSGNPVPINPIGTPEFGYGFVVMVGVLFVALLYMRRFREPEGQKA